MKTCDTCKHWDRSDDGKQYGTELNLRICRACPAYFNATEWDDEYNRRMKPEHASTTAFCQDGSDYAAYLYTLGNHGCTMHEPLDVEAKKP